MQQKEGDQPKRVGYPFGDDVEWPAVDRYGRVGIFTTGGVGPIPRAYLGAPELLEQLTDAISRLSESTEAHVLTDVPRPDDFLAFARRGCFAFDWADVHRVTERSDRYEIQARPRVPLTLAASVWPDWMRLLLEGTMKADLDFDQPLIAVTALDCERGF